MRQRLAALWNRHSQIPDEHLAVGALDRLTQRASLVLSRRVVLTGALGGIAASLGLNIVSPLQAAAQNCNTCWGPCTYCNTCTAYCCDPSGFYCRQGCCTCSCNCSCYRSKITVCDDGSYAVDCPCDCAICWPNCGCC